MLEKKLTLLTLFGLLTFSPLFSMDPNIIVTQPNDNTQLINAVNDMDLNNENESDEGDNSEYEDEYDDDGLAERVWTLQNSFQQFIDQASHLIFLDLSDFSLGSDAERAAPIEISLASQLIVNLPNLHSIAFSHQSNYIAIVEQVHERNPGLRLRRFGNHTTVRYLVERVTN